MSNGTTAVEKAAKKASEKIRLVLNQNLWVVIVCFAGMAAGEKYESCALKLYAAALGLVACLSVAATTIAYTIHYWKKKFK